MDRGNPTDPLQQPAPDAKPARNRKWIAPVVYAAVVLVPVLILIFSNTASSTLQFAGAEWNAPLWLILAATFVAGALVTRLVGWGWRRMRRRRKDQ